MASYFHRSLKQKAKEEILRFIKLKSCLKDQGRLFVLFQFQNFLNFYRMYPKRVVWAIDGDYALKC